MPMLAWAATDQHDKCSMDPPQPEPEGHSTPQDPPRLTARAVGPSPARLTVAGVRGNTAAMHTLLGAQGCRGPGEKEKEQEQTVRTSHLVKERNHFVMIPWGPGMLRVHHWLWGNQATLDLSHLINSKVGPIRICFLQPPFPKRKPQPEIWELFKNISCKT